MNASNWRILGLCRFEEDWFFGILRYKTHVIYEPKGEERYHDGRNDLG